MISVFMEWRATFQNGLLMCIAQSQTTRLATWTILEGMSFKTILLKTEKSKWRQNLFLMIKIRLEERFTTSYPDLSWKIISILMTLSQYKVKKNYLTQMGWLRTISLMLMEMSCMKEMKQKCIKTLFQKKESKEKKDLHSTEIPL